MEDEKIIALYWERNETAIKETQKKYGRYCHYIADRILGCHEDAEECVNDIYVRLWESIPPQRPEHFSAFLGKITRNLALNRYKAQTREKRGAGQICAVLDELAECIPDPSSNEITDELVLRDALNDFLRALPTETRKVFLRRYWYLSPISEIAADYRMSESKVKMILFRTRNKLKEKLKKDGIEV